MMAKMLNAESINRYGEVGMMSSFAYGQMVAFGIWDPNDKSTWKYTLSENRGGKHPRGYGSGWILLLLSTD